MNGGTRTPEYLALNPNGAVPFLVDGDLRLGESSAILRYLAENVGSDAYPWDSKARAKVDEALAWFATNLHEYFCLMTIYPNFGIPHGVDPELAKGMVAYGTEHSPRWLAILDQHMIGERAFVCGEQITIADYLGVAFITLGEAAAYDFGPYPNIRRWVATMRELRNWDATWSAFEGFAAVLKAQAASQAQAA
jgi:glutathione S-transferase